MNTVVINTDGSWKIIDQPKITLEDYQKVVGGWIEGNKLDFLFEWSGMIDVFIKIYILLLQTGFNACEYGLPLSWNA